MGLPSTIYAAKLVDTIYRLLECDISFTLIAVLSVPLWIFYGIIILR